MGDCCFVLPLGRELDDRRRQQLVRTIREHDLRDAGGLRVDPGGITDENLLRSPVSGWICSSFILGSWTRTTLVAVGIDCGAWYPFRTIRTVTRLVDLAGMFIDIRADLSRYRRTRHLLSAAPGELIK